MDPHKATMARWDHVHYTLCLIGRQACATHNHQTSSSSRTWAIFRNNTFQAANHTFGAYAVHIFAGNPGYLAATRAKAIGINEAFDTKYNKLYSDYKGLLCSIIGITNSNTNLQG